MDQDIRVQWMHTFGSTAASYSYFRVPYRCTLRDLQGTIQGDIGDAQTLTASVLSNSHALGVLTFGSTIAAGAIGTWVADATYGDEVLEADEVIKLTGSATGAAHDIAIDCELDPYAR
jgi:hypothetical protein